MKTWEVKIGDETHKLQLKKSSQNTNIWIMWTERDGKECRGTRTSLQRLDKETKNFFGVE